MDETLTKENDREMGRESAGKMGNEREMSGKWARNEREMNGKSTGHEREMSGK